MGVTECDREGCGYMGSMRYSDEYGYLCDECFEDLLMVNPPEQEIRTFMKTKKLDKENGVMMIRRVYFSDIFR